MTIKIIKVTKNDEVFYAPVPKAVEPGDSMEVLSVREDACLPDESAVAGGKTLMRNPMVYVKVNDKFQRILMKHILYVEAGGSYCTLYVHGMPAMLVSAPLAKVMPHLDAEYFIRVHRSFLVNKLHIESIAGNVLLVGKTSIPVSKSLKKEVLGRLNLLSFSK